LEILNWSLLHELEKDVIAPFVGLLIGYTRFL
jgi:hypothetical protein